MLTAACSRSARSQKRQPTWFPHWPTAKGRDTGQGWGRGGGEGRALDATTPYPAPPPTGSWPGGCPPPPLSNSAPGSHAPLAGAAEGCALRRERLFQRRQLLCPAFLQRWNIPPVGLSCSPPSRREWDVPLGRQVGGAVPRLQPEADVQRPPVRGSGVGVLVLMVATVPKRFRVWYKNKYALGSS